MGGFSNGYPQGGGMNQGQSPIANALTQRALQSRLNGQQPIQAGSPSQDPALSSDATPPAPPNIGGGVALAPGSPAAAAAARTAAGSTASTLAGLNLPPVPGQSAGGPPTPTPSGAPPTSKLNTPAATTQDGTGNPAASRTASPAASSSAVPASFQPPVNRAGSGGAAEIPNPTAGPGFNDTPATPGLPGNPINRSRGNVLAGLNRF